MVTFAVPEYQSVAHFALGVLLDRASLERIGCKGRYRLSVSLVQDDVDLLRDMGVIEGDCDLFGDEALEADDRATIDREFENELTELQRKLEAAHARARTPCDELFLEAA